MTEDLLRTAVFSDTAMPKLEHFMWDFNTQSEAVRLVDTNQPISLRMTLARVHIKHLTSSSISPLTSA